jgi:hypothetical protein
MGLQQFERRLERLVEGVFARAFRSGLQPVEVGRRLTREMDLRRQVAPKGILAPNRFTVSCSPEDRAKFDPIEDELVRELISVARDHARSEGYTFVGPVEVELETDDDLSPGMLLVAGEMAETVGEVIEPARDRPARDLPRSPVEPAYEREPPVAPAARRRAGATLILPDGRRLVLGTKNLVMGRLPECDLVLSDPNVSRRHAEVRPAGNGRFEAVDMGSTNGTKVNGVTIKGPQILRDGDQISLGATSLRFEQD